MANTTALTIGVKQAAKLLGCSEASAYVAARTGELPVIRVGKRLLVPRAALAKMLGIEAEAFEDRLRAQEVESENGTQFDALSNGGGPMED